MSLMAHMHAVSYEIDLHRTKVTICSNFAMNISNAAKAKWAQQQNTRRTMIQYERGYD
jgi:hypothetical protein